MQELLANQELLWIFTVVYDLGLAILLYRFFGKYGLYTAVVLGIILGNLQGGKVSELTLFGYSFTASMGAILYSGIYFATKTCDLRAKCCTGMDQEDRDMQVRSESQSAHYTRKCHPPWPLPLKDFSRI